MANQSDTDRANRDTSADTSSEPATTKELVQRQFGSHAAAYATSEVHAKGASLGRLVELLQPQPTWQVLDVATAAGHTAFALAPHVAQVTATDITPEMLPVAANVATEKGISNVVLEVADAEKLPYADASFDLVTCRIAPHHFPHVERFIAEAARVLRPGGRVAVVDNVVPGDESGPNSAANAAGAYINQFEKLRDPSHGRALSLAEWLSGFEAAGLTIDHHEIAPKAMVFTPWAERMGASAETIAELRRLLHDAPPQAADYFALHETADDEGNEGERDLVFYLQEGLIIGHKP